MSIPFVCVYWMISPIPNEATSNLNLGSGGNVYLLARCRWRTDGGCQFSPDLFSECEVFPGGIHEASLIIHTTLAIVS